MTARQNKSVDRGYATTVEDDGVNYREIAEIMTIMGFPMNHSSARNHVLRAMKKFGEEISTEWGAELDDEQLMQIVKDPNFQSGIADLLHIVEAQRRSQA